MARDGKARGVLHAIQPLFFDGSDQLAVHHDGGGGVGVIRVDPKYDHSFVEAALSTAGALPANQTIEAAATLLGSALPSGRRLSGASPIRSERTRPKGATSSCGPQESPPRF